MDERLGFEVSRALLGAPLSLRGIAARFVDDALELTFLFEPSAPQADVGLHTEISAEVIAGLPEAKVVRDFVEYTNHGEVSMVENGWRWVRRVDR